MIKICNERTISVLAGLFNVERDGIMYISIPDNEKVFIAYTVSSGVSDKVIKIDNCRVKLRDSKVSLEFIFKGLDLTIEY